MSERDLEDVATYVADAAQQTAALLNTLGIERVISVDDEYNPDYVQFSQLCRELGDRAGQIGELSDVPFVSGDDEVWGPVAERVWESLDEDRQREILRALAELAGHAPRRWTSILEELIDGDRLMRLSPSEWSDQWKSLLQSSREKKTLLLLDEELRETTKGMNIIADLVTATQAVNRSLICGLLTEKVRTNEAYESRRIAALEMGISEDDFLIISKDTLDPDPRLFARDLKYLLLNSYCRSLKDKVSKIVVESAEVAKARVNEISVEDLEHIVFRSSIDEGVWEADTLFRIWGLFERKAARGKARADKELRSMTSEIRKIAGIETVTDTRTYEAWKIRQQEIYEDGAYLANWHLPVEPGDIFECGNKGLLILLGQPCDMMVRRNGERNGFTYEATMALIRDLHPTATGQQPARDHQTLNPNEPAHNSALKESYFELPYFDEDDGHSWYVDLRKRYSVNLWVLDLCVYHYLGCARANLAQSCPDGLIPSWSKHYDKVHSIPRSALTKYVQLKEQGVDESLLPLVLPRPSNARLVEPLIFPEKKSICFQIKRVRRLLQPYFSGLLSRYAAYISRPAYEHDFARRDEQPANM